MAKRVSLQGAGDEDVARLRDLLGRGIPGLASAWRFHSGDDTDLVVIDVDTVYGHMDWLRAHASGRPVAVLTSHSQFTEADLVLHKPITAENLAELLNHADPLVADRPPEAAPPPAPAPVRSAAPVAAAPPAPPPAPEPPRERRLADWLVDGSLPGPVRLRHGTLPDLVLDPGTGEYYANAGLRLLADYCLRPSIAASDWESVSASELSALKAGGKAQPFTRLLWLCIVVGSNGQIAPGLDLNAKFKLARWPQIEREFAKHFRIATVMLKQPATLADIAEQSGASLADVIDFTNAYYAIGYIETDGGPRAAEAAQRDTGRGAILSRLRNPFGGG